MEQALSQARVPTNLTIKHETKQITTTTRTEIKVRSSDELSEAYYQPPPSIEPEAVVDPELNEMPTVKVKWQTKLGRKAPATADTYKPHIKAFVKSRGNSDIFIQEDIDDYFAEVKKVDDRKSLNERES